jgi:hypothetical protein
VYLLDKRVTDKSYELNIETCNLAGGQRTVVLSDTRLGNTANGFSDVTWLADGRVLFSLPEPPPNEKDVNIWQSKLIDGASFVDLTTSSVLVFVFVGVAAVSIWMGTRRLAKLDVMSVLRTE